MDESPHIRRFAREDDPSGETAARARRRELELTWVRWFAAVLAGGLLATTSRVGGTDAPIAAGVRISGGILALALFAVNVLISLWLRRPRSPVALRRVGIAAFTFDAVVVLGLAWLFTFPIDTGTWTIPFVLLLEGALRYRLRGALIAGAMIAISEPLREAVGAAAYDLRFDLPLVLFRIGIAFLIAIVAGLMAERFERERAQAEDRALELLAFHRIVLAGAAGVTLAGTVDRIVREIARGLGYESFGICVVEQEHERPVVRLAGAAGFPPGSLGQSVPVGEGVVGRAVATGEPQLISDTRADPDYVELIPFARSEVCIPISARGRVIGAIDVESATPDRFGPADVDRLLRLSPQIGVIIENVRLLERERAAAERLRELDGMKTDFVAVTSHELRTPLTAISGMVKTLLRRDQLLQNEERLDFYRTIDRRTDRLILLVEDLLLVSQIERKALEVSHGETDAGTIVASVLVDLGREAARVRVTMPEDPTLVTDGERLAQVLRNLVENAAKFSDRSAPVNLRVTRERGAMLFEVADHGPGISPGDQARIFEAFHQAEGPMRRAGSGFGLGLHIAKTLSDALGAAIGVRSNPGLGSTFWVRVPIGSLRAPSAERPRTAAAVHED